MCTCRPQPMDSHHVLHQAMSMGWSNVRFQRCSQLTTLPLSSPSLDEGLLVSLVVVSVLDLDCQSRGLGFKSQPWQKLGLGFSAPTEPPSQLSYFKLSDLTYIVSGTIRQ